MEFDFPQRLRESKVDFFPDEILFPQKLAVKNVGCQAYFRSVKEVDSLAGESVRRVNQKILFTVENQVSQLLSIMAIGCTFNGYHQSMENRMG